MMTISESIIEWLQTYENQKIQTDRLAAKAGSYALTKTPTDNVDYWLSGAEIHNQSYQFAVRLPASTDAERVENQNWFAGLESWIRQKNDAEEYPPLEPGCKCMDISVASPAYLGAGDDKMAVYAMTIRIKFRKKG